MKNQEILQALINEAERRGFHIRQEDEDYIHMDCEVALEGELAYEDKHLLLAIQALV